MMTADQCGVDDCLQEMSQVWVQAHDISKPWMLVDLDE